ncbi:MAG TPA: hypothetical protein VFV95_14155 [Vicinamibacterales bacterium]|nr:hypothetical protein [Vicinamibacterales bacterium]
MTTRHVTAAALLAIVWVAVERAPARVTPVAAQTVKVSRLKQNPLITVNSSPTLGGNVNGPSVIRVPDWIERPLGRYYLYFANHRGDFIRLAYADSVGGPWKVHEPGVLHVRDTALFRLQPDSARFGGFNTHLASPEIFVDAARKRIVLWAHGWWTNNEQWPTQPAAAQRWADEKGYGQFTQSSVSSDGLRFTAQPAITKESYLRVFPHGGAFYGMSRLGRLLRATDLTGSFEPGPNPFQATAYARRVRHVALAVRGNRLIVFFTAIGDAPERMLMSTIDMAGDWSEWRASTPVEIMRPETEYECAGLPVAPSEVGDVEVPVRQIRDPFLFEEQGRTILFYSTCGEQGIAAAEIAIP